MDINKVLEIVIQVDKKIFRIYEEMTVNDYLNKPNDLSIIELKKLIELENWAYKQLNLNYEDLKNIIDELEKIPITNLEKEISKDILLKKVTFNYNELLEYRIENKYVEKLVLCRIYDYLTKTYYLFEQTPKDINCYIERGKLISKKDDETDIYITDDSYLTMRYLTSKEYQKIATMEHNIVLAFNTNCKKELEKEAQVDIEQVITMLLEIKSDMDTYNRYFYIDEVYRRIFNNKTLENRVINADFIFDNLFEQFSIQSSYNKANKKFLKVYRSQISYLIIYDLIHYLFNFKDNNFIGNNVISRYNIITFNIYIEILKGYISVMRSDELEAIKKTCYIHYQDVIKDNEYAKMVYSCFKANSYDQLQGFINIGIDKEKIKQYK